METQPTERFTSRVSDYVKCRPGYPAEIISYLKRRWGLDPDLVVADIGSGTGLLARLFLENGNLVYGVEPNRAMREAGEELLREHARFVSVEGSAESTTLPDRSVDAIVAGQAFHWFDVERAREEFARILRPAGWIALIWNKRKADGSPFLEAYEALLGRFGNDYASVSHHRLDDATLEGFFEPGTFEVVRFPNRQRFDYEGVKGRLLSSSYAPQAGHPDHEPMIEALRRLFEQYQEEGRIDFLYETEIYSGTLRYAPSSSA